MTAGFTLHVTRSFFITYRGHAHAMSMSRERTPLVLGVVICIILMFYCETVSAVLPICNCAKLSFTDCDKTVES